MYIHILRTNITTESFNTVKRKLNSDNRIEFWTIDMEDIDRVLRIKSNSLSLNETVKILKLLEINAQDLDPFIQINNNPR